MEINLAKVIPFVLVIFATLTAISSSIRNISNTEHELQIDNERQNAIINLTNSTQSTGAKFEDAVIVQRYPTIISAYNILQKNYNNIAKNQSTIINLNNTINQLSDISNIDNNIENLFKSNLTDSKNFNINISNPINYLNNKNIDISIKGNLSGINKELANIILKNDSKQNLSQIKPEIKNKLKLVEDIVKVASDQRSTILKYQKSSIQMAMAIFNQNESLQKAQDYINNSVKDFPQIAKQYLPEFYLAKYVLNNENISNKNYYVDYPSCKVPTQCTMDEIVSIENNLSKFVENGILFHMDKSINKTISITTPLISFVNSLTLVFLIFLVIAPGITLIAIKEFLFK